MVTVHTVTPRYGDALKEDQEQQTHPAGRVVVKQFEHIDSTLGPIYKKRRFKIIKKTKTKQSQGI